MTLQQSHLILEKAQKSPENELSDEWRANIPHRKKSPENLPNIKKRRIKKCFVFFFSLSEAGVF